MSIDHAAMIPASYVARWIALLEARGVSGKQALAGTGITLATLDDPHARLTIPALIQVITTGAELAGDPSLGLELGLAARLFTGSTIYSTALTALFKDPGLAIANASMRS